MKEENSKTKYLSNTKNPYQIKIGDIFVKMEYQEEGKRFNECMLNLLKQKRKMD